MTHKFAERGAIQSGQRFLDSSAPRLIRHAAFCKAAAGDFPSPPAGKEEKLSRGAGQGPAISRAWRACLYLACRTTE